VGFIHLVFLSCSTCMVSTIRVPATGSVGGWWNTDLEPGATDEPFHRFLPADLDYILFRSAVLPPPMGFLPAAAFTTWGFLCSPDTTTVLPPPGGIHRFYWWVFGLRSFTPGRSLPGTNVSFTTTYTFPGFLISFLLFIRLGGRYRLR